MRAKNKYYAHAKFVFEFLEIKKKVKRCVTERIG